MRKRLSTIVKVIISVAGLLYVFSRVPLTEFGNELANIRWGWVAVAILVVYSGIVLRAFRWQTLVRGLNVNIPFGRLVVLYFVGSFFNTFLPTGFGGDVVRVMEASRDAPAHVAAGTVIVDRLTGLFMLFMMALVALPFRPDDYPQFFVWSTVLISLAGLVGGGLLLEGNLIRRLGWWLPGILSVTDKKRPLAKLLDTLQAVGGQPLLGALAVSTLFNLLLVGVWWLFSRALGYQISYSYLLLVVPTMAVFLLIPSIGGLGVRESIAPVLLAAAGLTAAQAVALAFTVTVLVRLASLIGGPIYAITALTEGESLRPPPIENEEGMAEEHIVSTKE